MNVETSMLRAQYNAVMSSLQLKRSPQLRETVTTNFLAYVTGLVTQARGNEQPVEITRATNLDDDTTSDSSERAVGMAFDQIDLLSTRKQNHVIALAMGFWYSELPEQRNRIAQQQQPHQPQQEQNDEDDEIIDQLSGSVNQLNVLN